MNTLKIVFTTCCLVCVIYCQEHDESGDSSTHLETPPPDYDMILATTRPNSNLLTTSKLAKLEDQTTKTKGIMYDSSAVIVWENCAMQTRLDISTIFESNLRDSTKRLILAYDPTLNSLLFEVYESKTASLLETNVVSLSLPEFDKATGTLFFMFSHPNQIYIYQECPNANKKHIKFNSDWIGNLTFLEIQNSAQAYSDITEVLKRHCRSSVTIQPTTVVKFPCQLNNFHDVLIFSMFYESQLYSFVYVNSSFHVRSLSNQLEVVELEQGNSLNSTQEFFLVFTSSGVHIYDKCPSTIASSKSIGFWNTTIFSRKVQIETSRVYSKAIIPGSNEELLSSFCLLNGLKRFFKNEQSTSLTDSNICVNAERFKHDFLSLERSIQIASLFLPLQDQIEKLELFDQLSYMSPFSLNRLLVIQPRLLIASRDHPRPGFFSPTQRSISDYENGFTDGQSNLWLGLKELSKLTNKKQFKLRIEITTDKNEVLFEEYESVVVGSKSERYRLQLGHLTSLSGITLDVQANITGSFSFCNNSEFSEGFWSLTLAFCFTCDTSVHFLGSSNPVYLAQVRKMYLIP